MRSKWVMILFLAMTTAFVVTGCGSIPVDVKAAGDGFIEDWEYDKRPTLPDAEYDKLAPEQQKLYMPKTLEDARRFSHKQWRERTK